MIRLSPNDACLMTARMRPPVSDRDKKFRRVLLIGWKCSALDLVFNYVTNWLWYLTKKLFFRIREWIFVWWLYKKSSLKVPVLLCRIFISNSDLYLVFSVSMNWFKFKRIIILYLINMLYNAHRLRIILSTTVKFKMFLTINYYVLVVRLS